MRISFYRVAVLLWLLSGAAFAQDFRATLTGVVTDPAAQPSREHRQSHSYQHQRIQGL